MAGKNQAALAVCAQTKVIFPFKLGRSGSDLFMNEFLYYGNDVLLSE